MKYYELAFIFKSNLNEKEVKELISTLEKNIVNLKGKVISNEDWGMRKLSFPIKGQDTGYYYFMKIELETENIGKMEKNLKLDNRLLRYMIEIIPNLV